MSKKKLTEAAESKRLHQLYKNIPPNKYALADGLIEQAARLRVQLDVLWEDISKKGTTELFSQSEKTEPYERERPSARLFLSMDKNYQTIINKLNDLLPSDSAISDELGDLIG